MVTIVVMDSGLATSSRPGMTKESVSSLRGAQRRSNPRPMLMRQWIASRSLSSGGASRRPLARNDGKGLGCRHSPDAAQRAALAAWCAADLRPRLRNKIVGRGSAEQRERRCTASGTRYPLPPNPFRRALLRERLWSLDVILRRYHRLHGRVLALLGHRLLERNRKTLLH